MKTKIYTIKAKNILELDKSELDKPTVIGTCSGIRGFEQGAVLAGFRDVYSSDLEYHPGVAFYNNHEGVYQTGADITKLDFSIVKSFVQTLTDEIIRKGEIDCFLSGSPCKWISRMNTQRRNFIASNMLMLEQIRLVNEFKPKVAVFEQVDAFHDATMSDLKNEFMASLVPLKKDYNIQDYVMNAMDYGARQDRKRAIFMLVRKDVGVPGIPLPTPPDLGKVGVNVLLPHVDYTSSGQFADVMVPTAGRIYSTMTAGGGEWFYEAGKDRRAPTTEERLILSCLEGYDLSGISRVNQTKLLGNMVQIPFSEALLRHIRVHILKC